MLNIEGLNYEELDSLAKFLVSIGRTSEADEVYDYLGKVILEDSQNESELNALENQTYEG
jgi:hypothetical protein